MDNVSAEKALIEFAVLHVEKLKVTLLAHQDNMIDALGETYISKETMDVLYPSTEIK